ncbi:MAG: 16S rRNA (guanine(966)-N(2))-methyltransferase RsmD [Burkholderiales bacterium]|nr:16S rRNA (guanine(966)-N(2))-methyltransferase RsmD [Burkholderiales bacterium]
MRRQQPAGAPRAARDAGARAGQVRIIGGQWRRRLLRFPPIAGLRPTPDRVRETLFNWLGQDLTGRRCLDLFCGSGALAFEALSRNAREVTMVENQPAACRALEAAAQAFAAGQRARLVAGDALQFLRKAGGESSFDIVFLDPPFGMGWVERVWPALAPLVATDGSVYVEAERAFVPPVGWTEWKAGRAGAVHYGLFRRTREGDE